MPKYSPTAIYKVILQNGTGPCTARWNEERKMWIVNHPFSGPNSMFPESAIKEIQDVIYL